MENTPVISFTGFRLPDDTEAVKRVRDWVNAAHRPLRRQSPWWLDVHRYDIVKKNPAYPDRISVWHFNSLDDYEKNLIDPAWKAATDDERGLRTKYGYQTLWYPVYELQTSFRHGAVFYPAGKENLLAGSAQILFFSAFNLSPFLQDKFAEWFSRWGYAVFLPLFLKLPGLTGYDFYKFIKFEASYDDTGNLEKDYPAFLSLLYFEDLNALENYRKSPELATFQKVLQADFSGALNTRWDVAYKLESIFKRE
jgi:hypothetical protein